MMKYCQGEDETCFKNAFIFKRCPIISGNKNE
jgi:hypothetical protein